MDDRTTPSAHVRQVLQGLSPILPPSYLLSSVMYVMPSPKQPMAEEHDLRLMVRSRMAGVLGLSCRQEEVDEGTIALLADEIELCQQVRSLVRDGAGTVRTPQTGANARPPWELMQQLAWNRRAAVIEAIRNDPAVGTVRVVPRGLDPDIDYGVWVPYVGRVGSWPGRRLLADGFDLRASATTSASVALIRPAEDVLSGASQRAARRAR